MFHEYFSEVIGHQINNYCILLHVCPSYTLVANLCQKLIPLMKMSQSSYKLYLRSEGYTGTFELLVVPGQAKHD